MSVFKNIKIELAILIIVVLNVFLSFRVDFGFYNYFNDLGESLNYFYLKEFFTKVTELGSSSLYFIVSFVGIIFLYINKKFKIVFIKNNKKLINFFISFIIYLLTIGIVTQIIKHLVGRPRPNYTNFEDSFSFNFFTFDSNFHSFPSGHSSTIFMVCFVLCTALPKLKYFFYFLASIVAFSRVIVGAHFFTDILAGALLALIVFKVLNTVVDKNFKKYSIDEFVFIKHSIVYYYIIFLFCCCLFLTAGPALDLYVSELFFYRNPECLNSVFFDCEFLLQSHYIVSKIFREGFLPLILIYILILPIVGLYFKIEKIFFGYKFSIKEIILIWSTQILTIVIFVNMILKNMWGRSRPGDIFEFGGKETFTPWYELSNNCDSNCSFVSGDASVGFSIIILYFITKNIYFVYLGIVFGFILGFIRIIAGGHFLSDILFAGFFIIVLNFVIFKLYQKYYE